MSCDYAEVNFTKIISEKTILNLIYEHCDSFYSYWTNIKRISFSLLRYREIQLCSFVCIRFRGDLKWSSRRALLTRQTLIEAIKKGGDIKSKQVDLKKNNSIVIYTYTSLLYV